MRASRVVFGVTAVTVIAAAAGRPSVAAPMRPGGPLVLISFAQDGRTDIWRNEVLEFRFSQPLRRGSVTERTLRIGRPAPDGLFLPAEGARVVKGNVVRFDTRRTQANYDASRQPNATYVEVDRPEGLMANGTFTVRLPAMPGAPMLKTRDGRAIALPFTGSFVTNDKCIDPVEGAPWFIGDHGTGLLGIDPPRGGATGLIEADASIVFEFSEPVLSTSLVLGKTVLITHAKPGTNVPGTISPDSSQPGGRRFVFRPTTNYGSFAPGYGEDVYIRLTKGITDLGGNPLQREFGPAHYRSREPQ